MHNIYTNAIICSIQYSGNIVPKSVSKHRILFELLGTDDRDHYHQFKEEENEDLKIQF